MSWRDDLLPASFRGVPFFWREHERVGGRRVVVSELPFRDLVATEDLGRAVKKFELTGYVLGEDYFANRDALLAACEDNGTPGTLVHPYLGELRVRCQTVRIIEQQEKGRVCTFQMGFVESGEEATPAAPSTRSSLLALARNVLLVARRVFALVNTLRNMPPGVLLGFLGEIAGGYLGRLVGIPGISVSSIRNEINGLLRAFTSTPTADEVAARLAAPAAAALAAAAAATAARAALSTTDSRTNLRSGSAGPARVGAVAQSSRGAGDDPARAVGFVLLAGFPATTAAADATQAAIRRFAQDCEVVAAAMVFTDCSWPNAAEAEAARTALLDAIDLAAEAAADAGQDELYDAWRALFSAAALDMAERVKQAPILTTYAVPRPIGSLALGHRLYRDAGRADELVALANVPHPGFLPPTGPALAE